MSGEKSLENANQAASNLPKRKDFWSLVNRAFHFDGIQLSDAPGDTLEPLAEKLHKANKTLVYMAFDDNPKLAQAISVAIKPRTHDGDNARLPDEVIQRNLVQASWFRHTPWMVITDLFEGEIPGDVSLDRLDNILLNQRDYPEILAIQKEFRMIALIDMVLRNAEHRGHTAQPLSALFKAAQNRAMPVQISEPDAVPGVGLGTLSAVLGKPRTIAEPEAEARAPVNPFAPSNPGEFRALFEASVRTGILGNDIANEFRALTLNKTDDGVFLQRRVTAEAELTIAKYVKMLAERDFGDRLSSLRDAVAADPKLSADQKANLQYFCDTGFGVLTGPPGSGKTHSLATLIKYAVRNNQLPSMAAPVGKAAERLTALLRKLAVEDDFAVPERDDLPTTIHSMLGSVHNEHFGFRIPEPKDKISAPFLVIEEGSMLTVHLTAALIRAVDHSRTAILWNGDPHQLQPIGPGRPFEKLVEVHETLGGPGPLTGNERFGKENPSHPIGPIADRLRKRDHLILRPHRTASISSGFAFHDLSGPAVPERKPPQSADDIVAILQEGCAEFGLDPIRDSMILAPQYQGYLGINALNNAMKAAFNPARDDDGFNNYNDVRVNIGDKVIMTGRNLKNHGIMNGTTGLFLDMVKIQEENRMVDAALIDIGVTGSPKHATVPVQHMRCLNLAYAITAHRAQGDEAPFVVFIADGQNRSMITRPMLLMAMTRMKTALAMVGDRSFVERQARVDPPPITEFLNRRVDIALAKAKLATAAAKPPPSAIASPGP